MRLVTYDAGDGPRIGAMREGALVDLADAVGGGARVPTDMGAFLAMAGNEFGLFTEAVARHDGPLVEDARLLAPVPRPGAIVGVGRNYGAHADEGGLGRQERPRLFAKLPGSVTGPGAPIVRPTGVAKLDWEAELAVVVGRTMRDVPEADALAHVAGYTILNDVSAREYQFDLAPPQTTFAKSMDSFTPMGPELVTVDSFDAADVGLRCWIDGALMQEGRTSDMIFPPAVVLSYVSRFVTLRPGDVVATGTPAGVGHFRDPPVYLRPGNTVRIEIDGLGELENPVVGGSHPLGDSRS